MDGLGRIDGRTKWAKRRGELVSAYLDALGGEAVVSAAQKNMVCLIADLQVDLEKQRPAILASAGISDKKRDLFQRGVNTVGRRLEQLGIGHVAKPVQDVPRSLRDG